ncbi:replication-relaxation family protein [Burkholderiaceae bacterium DAT-1]|nr:replication-relaxation family protein [Burkholderiaceae bacterium DAT-1]
MNDHTASENQGEKVTISEKTIAGGTSSNRRTRQSKHLIADPAKRMARAEEKRRTALRFLRDEIWTTVDVISHLLAIAYPAAYALMKQLKQVGYVNSGTVFIPSHRGVVRSVLYGITAQGLAYAWDLSEDPEQRSPWESSKISPLFVPHQIATQKARIRAEKLGWSAWKPARMMMGTGLSKIPDGEMINLEGQCIAVEIEREIKTDKRYEAVLGAYIALIKRDRRWSRIDYLCPDQEFAARLARNFGRLKQLRLEGKNGKATHVGELSQAHLDHFRFYVLDEWPDGAYITAKLKVTP